MFSRLLVLPVFLLSLLSCGSSDGRSPFLVDDTVETGDDLFRIWTADANETLDIEGLLLDLTDLEYGDQRDYAISFNDGAVCECLLYFVEFGMYVLSSCVYLQKSGTRGDPQCNSWDHTGTFGIVDNVLTLDTVHGTITYR